MDFTRNYRIKELKDRLSSTFLTDSIDFTRFYEELLSFFSESVEEYVDRRYLELKKEGFKNKEIYSMLSVDIPENLFKGKKLSERQIKRIIYKE